MLTNHGFSISDENGTLPYNILNTNYTYINELGLPSIPFRNKYYVHLEEQDKSKLKNIAMGTFLVYVDDVPTGTAIHIAPNIFLTARHCIDICKKNSKVELVACYLKPGKPCCFYRVANLSPHPDEDAAILFTVGSPHEQLKTKVSMLFEEQPCGGYYILHHAGGLPLQVSSGSMPDFGGGYYQLKHFLLADAGPLASGAGVFDASTCQLIGINTARTLELTLTVVSRCILALHSIKDWLSTMINTGLTQTQHEGIKETRINMPVPYLLSEEQKELYKTGDLETMTWARANLQAQAIQQLLAQLDDYLRGNIQRNAIQLPLFLNTYVGLDSHQSQHLGSRGNKTRIREMLGSNVANPLIQVLGAAITSICNMYNYRLTQNVKQGALQTGLLVRASNSNEWAVDLSPLVIGFDDKTPCTIARIDGNPLGSFHYYPIHYNDDDVINHKANIISANDLLNYITNYEHNIERDYHFHNRVHQYHPYIE